MIGWIGVGLLVLAYCVLLTPYFKHFLIVDAVASLLLTTHAIIINDVPFILVNGFITLTLSIKYFKEVKK